MAGFLQADRKVKKGDSGILDGDGAVTLKYTDVAQCAQDISILPFPALIRRGNNEGPCSALAEPYFLAELEELERVLEQRCLPSVPDSHGVYLPAFRKGFLG